MAEQVSVPDYNKVWTNIYGDMQHVGPVHRHIKRIIRRLLNSLDYQTVLDVGCGPGDNVARLLEGHQVQRFSGVDISTWAIEQARRKHPAGDFHAFNVENERLDGQWDIIFCSFLLEHVPNDVATLKNMRAMTGKYALVATIAGNFERYKRWDIRVGHVRNYQVGELERKMQEAGFIIEKTIYWGFPFYSPLGRMLQNISTVGTGRLSLFGRIAAEIMHLLYYLNSHRRGDVLVVLARV
jgi:SAM-dependent methyltransferase